MSTHWKYRKRNKPLGRSLVREDWLDNCIVRKEPKSMEFELLVIH